MTTLNELVGTKWKGSAELWLDPKGNEPSLSDCEVSIRADGIDYTWSHEDTAHTGRIDLKGPGGSFTDTFHSATPMPMKAPERPSTALFDVQGVWGPPDAPWGWRIWLSCRPVGDFGNGELVLQMTNITPWGEENRAVRMVCDKA